MSGAGISLAVGPEVRAFGKSVGRRFSADEVETISRSVSSVATIEDDGRLNFKLGERSCDLGEVIAAMSTGYGTLAEPDTTNAPIVPLGATRTAQAVATNAAREASRTSELSAQAQTMADTHGNPWDGRYINRTRQAFITKNNPILAARLKIQAGVRP